MPDWFERLKNAIEADGIAVLVTVVAVSGSVPREVGASLVVSRSGISGTIGGGNLEHKCEQEARRLLNGEFERESSGDSTARYKKFSLGPSLGQCCGGRVELLFESVSAKTPWVSELLRSKAITRSLGEDASYWLCRSRDCSVARILSAVDLEKIKPVSGVDRGIDLQTSSASVVLDAENSRWLCQPLSELRREVWVHGAGHVGQAVVSQLILLDCRVTLLDHRDEWLQLQPDLAINRILTEPTDHDVLSCSAMGRSEVGNPEKAAHVVMTHSHALDFNICLDLLNSAKFDWLGLIGSATKRNTFIKRLQQRGISQTSIDRLHCPIGNLTLQSSKPEVIALSLAAELMLHWQSTSSTC